METRQNISKGKKTSISNMLSTIQAYQSISNITSKMSYILKLLEVTICVIKCKKNDK